MALDLQLVRSTAQRVAASYGLDVVDVAFQGAGKFRALTVFIEKNAANRAELKAKLEAEIAANPEARRDDVPSGLLGHLEQLSFVTHEDCAAFSTDFGTLIDIEDLIPGGEYVLEVSSPGLDRKLTAPEDFRRFAGSLVKVQTREPLGEGGGNRHWQGHLAEVTENGFVIDLSAVKQKGKARKAAASSVAVEFKNVEKANLVPEV
jgi:ribosome maturation factor RimP